MSGCSGRMPGSGSRELCLPASPSRKPGGEGRVVVWPDAPGVRVRGPGGRSPFFPGQTLPLPLPCATTGNPANSKLERVRHLPALMISSNRLHRGEIRVARVMTRRQGLARRTLSWLHCLLAVLVLLPTVCFAGVLPSPPGREGVQGNGARTQNPRSGARLSSLPWHPPA